MVTDRLQICLPDVKMILPRAPVGTALAPSTSVALNSYQYLSAQSQHYSLMGVLMQISCRPGSVQQRSQGPSSASSSYSLHPYLGMSIASSSLF